MRKAAGTYFPVGIGSISSYLKKNGYDVTFVDPNAQPGLDIEKIVELIGKARPLLVGISFMTPQFRSARKISDAIKKYLPETKIVLGGAHPSALPDKTLEQIQTADFVISGEGEDTTLELMRSLEAGDVRFHGIKGISWRENGKIVINELRPPIEDLDSLPYTDRGLIDQSLYHAQSFLSYSSKAMAIYTSRGCPGRCVFCASGHRLRSKVRLRSIDNVMGEVEYLKKKFSIDYLLIKDDVFTLNKARVSEFCAAMRKDFPGMKWHCMIRVNSVDRGILTEMKASGLNDVFVGIESGNDDILRRSQKGISTQAARKTVEECYELGIRTYGSFIVGLPGDTRETIAQTIDFACSIPLTMAGFSILIPYPGTQAYEDYYDPDKDGCEDYSQFIASTGMHYVEGYTGVQRDLLELLPGLLAKAQKSFYLRPEQIMRILRVSTPSMLIGCGKGFFALVNKEICRKFGVLGRKTPIVKGR